jgi:TonB family protein
MEDPLAQLRRPDPLAGLPSRPAVVEDAYKGLAYALPYDWTRTDGVVVVRLTQAADGHVLSAELLASSGDPGLDGAAVSSVQALGEESGPPPPEVRRGRDAVVSEWRFELLRTVSGPSALGVGFTGLPSFAGRSHVRVTLVAYH